MGIAKDIKLLGNFDFYSPSYLEFSQIISDKFKVNLNLRFDNYTENIEINKPDEFLDFECEKTFSLYVTLNDYDNIETKEEKTYLHYVLSIPVCMPYTNYLQLEFFPNGIFQLSSIPFNNKWYFFIDDIKGLNKYLSYEFIKDRILKIRVEYWSILNKINCNKVIIFADAFYKTEELFINTQIINKEKTLNEILLSFKNLDKVTAFDFIDSLTSKDRFDNLSDLDIIFTDKH